VRKQAIVEKGRPETAVECDSSRDTNVRGSSPCVLQSGRHQYPRRRRDSDVPLSALAPNGAKKTFYCTQFSLF